MFYEPFKRFQVQMIHRSLGIRQKYVYHVRVCDVLHLTHVSNVKNFQKKYIDHWQTVSQM